MTLSFTNKLCIEVLAYYVSENVILIYQTEQFVFSVF
jgi:hypothetical protein